MSDYTPTTEDVRLVYMANCNSHCSVDHQAEFNRWLKSVQAEAWDAGRDAQQRSQHAEVCDEPNPHREETE